MSAERPLRVGVSSCLAGERVRYDGGHKRDSFVADVLSPHVELVPICPEVELGLGVPRETIRLERSGGGVRLVAPGSGRDHTEAMRALSLELCRRLEALDLAGYVLKESSPSCGLDRVKVHDRKGGASRSGRGAFASVLLERFPRLPVEEEGRLLDPALRDGFIVRLFAYRRVHDLFLGRWAMRDLVAFHAAEKLLLLAHSPAAYRELGALVARAKALPRAEVASRYQDAYLGALERLPTRRRHVNALQHAAGYLRKLASPDERREVAELIEGYLRGLVPLVVPLTLLAHLARRFSIAYLAGQRYLSPHPKELLLRNHA